MSPYIARARARYPITLSWIRLASLRAALSARAEQNLIIVYDKGPRGLARIRWMVFHNLQFVFCQVVCNIYCIICFYFFSTALCRRQKDQLRICKQEIDFWYMGFKMSLLHHIFTIIEKLHLVYIQDSGHGKGAYHYPHHLYRRLTCDTCGKVVPAILSQKNYKVRRTGTPAS